MIVTRGLTSRLVTRGYGALVLAGDYLVVSAATFVLEAQEIMMLALTESLLHSRPITPRPRIVTVDPRLRP